MGVKLSFPESGVVLLISRWALSHTLILKQEGLFEGERGRAYSKSGMRNCVGWACSSSIALTGVLVNS